MDYNRCYRVNGKDFELQHHGVKGMKWGVRRYQNKDGSLTPAGKRRKAKDEYRTKMREINAEDRRTGKRVATALLMTATAAAAVAAYRKNPDLVRSALSKVGNTTVSAAKKAKSKAYEAGQQYVKDAIKGAKEGFAEGIKNAPKNAARKATDAIITGATMMTAKRILDATVGREEAARIFQANNNKKIGSFWKVSQDDKDDD